MGLCEHIIRKRLEKNNLTNLFGEIAMYHSDLKIALGLNFPRNIPLVIIDTDFEQNHIKKAVGNKQKKELVEWREHAKTHYKSISKNSMNGCYLPLETTEHILPFENPELIVELVKSGCSHSIQSVSGASN